VRPLPIDHIAGAEPRMRDNAARVRRLLDVPIPLLLLGETGTGKEAFAKAIHESSARHARPFVAVNCAAIPESLIESELFGYTDGAFTGARAKGMRGRIQQASGGTLFLDEIGDMPLALQTRLLRVLAEGEIQPLGGGDTQRVDLHVICATHRDLAALVRAGRFRQDLYYRLAGASFVLPPLRTRSDVPVLMEAILAEECAAAGRSAVLDGSALDALLTHTWPGNIRELRNALRYAVAMTPDGVIASECLPAYLAGPMLPPDIPAVERGIAPDDDDYDERQRVITALRSTHWCAASAARVLGISRATLYRRMHQHRIVSPNRADLSGSE
jgi:transcriptional regulator of acetoin/glycerol metabolism